MAWGDLTPVAETLLANAAKFGSVLFGVDFAASDPDLIDRLAEVPGAFVAKNRPGCFHSKIFYFSSGAKAEAIVGSANFTKRRPRDESGGQRSREGLGRRPLLWSDPQSA